MFFVVVFLMSCSAISRYGVRGSLMRLTHAANAKCSNAVVKLFSTKNSIRRKNIQHMWVTA